MRRITSALPVFALALSFGLALGACPGNKRPDNPLLRGVPDANAAVQEGCYIARDKCTRCHTIERLLTAKPATPVAWQHYVRRMRLMPGASIHEEEEPKIVQCLVYRGFGAKGLASLEGEAP